jgi:hypothetical protein
MYLFDHRPFAEGSTANVYLGIGYSPGRILPRRKYETPEINFDIKC